MSVYVNLITALERGNAQLIDLLACQIFLDEKGNPRLDQIYDFVSQYPEIKNEVVYVQEVHCNVGTIVFNGNKYYYSPFIGGR